MKPNVLVVIGGARRDGYTVKFVSSAIEGIESVGVNVELIHLLDYKFGPCTSCYSCIRSESHVCILDDDFGRNGDGILYRKVEEANAIPFGVPTHLWSVDSATYLFLERLYPFIWSDKLNLG